MAWLLSMCLSKVKSATYLPLHATPPARVSGVSKASRPHRAQVAQWEGRGRYCDLPAPSQVMSWAAV